MNFTKLLSLIFVSSVVIFAGNVYAKDKLTESTFKQMVDRIKKILPSNVTLLDTKLEDIPVSWSAVNDKRIIGYMFHVQANNKYISIPVKGRDGEVKYRPSETLWIVPKFPGATKESLLKLNQEVRKSLMVVQSPIADIVGFNDNYILFCSGDLKENICDKVMNSFKFKGIQ